MGEGFGAGVYQCTTGSQGWCKFITSRQRELAQDVLAGGKGSADSTRAARTQEREKRGEPETESEARVKAREEQKRWNECTKHGSKRRLITVDRVCCQDGLGYVE